MDTLLRFADGTDIRKLLDRTVSIGLYVVQSEWDPSIYRAGSAGTQRGRGGTLYKRLSQHHGLPPRRPDINWTEYHSRWKAIWAVQLPTASQNAGELAEQLLFGMLAAHYYLIPESGRSGFIATPDSVSEIVKLARELEPAFQRIVNRQSDEPHRTKWIKNDPVLIARREAALPPKRSRKD